MKRMFILFKGGFDTIVGGSAYEAVPPYSCSAKVILRCVKGDYMFYCGRYSNAVGIIKALLQGNEKELEERGVPAFKNDTGGIVMDFSSSDAPKVEPLKSY